MTVKNVITIRYPNGAERSLIRAPRNYRCRDANGKTYRVNDSTARRVLEEFNELCNEQKASLVTLDDYEVMICRINCAR